MFKTESRQFKIFTFLASILVIIIILARNINPFADSIFSFHDETQAARIQEFTFNLQEKNFPPRIAPHFSYGLGYPMFNFYAPFPYWVTSLFDLVGFDVITSLKLSFILLILVAFSGMFLLLKQYTHFYASILGAVVYTVSPWIAVEIFVRGNLAELWFFALFPLALYLLKTNTKKRILLTVLIISFLFTSHNVLSLVSVGILILFGLFTKLKWMNLISVLLGLLASAYFLIPAMTEMQWIYASDVATKTLYDDHFLCITQLWSSQWGFAGSAKGCGLDGMSFMVGKINILVGLAGLLVWIHLIYKKKLDFESKQGLIIAILLIGSIFMVTEYSAFLWKLTEPISSLFQFPWRLILFILFGLAFFAGFFTNIIPIKTQFIAIAVLMIAILYGNHEYFYGNSVVKKEYKQMYLSDTYINNKVAYKVAEYLPRTASYNYWRSLENAKVVLNTKTPIVTKEKQEVLELENKPFTKLLMVKSPDKKASVNIHYAPYWQILINNVLFTPTNFDSLGRPEINVSDTDFDSVSVKYIQTPIEQIANIISLCTVLGLTIFTINQFHPSWKSIKIKKI